LVNRGIRGTANAGGYQPHQPRFDIRTESASKTVHVFLAGELDLACEQQFLDRLKEVTNNAFSHVVLDLSEVTFIDSTGLRLLIGEWERSRRDGFDLVFVKGSDAVQRVLEVTGLEGVLPIVDDASEISQRRAVTGPTGT
jgi:anti-anti-sigma factor